MISALWVKRSGIGCGKTGSDPVRPGKSAEKGTKEADRQQRIPEICEDGRKGDGNRSGEGFQ